MRRLSFATSMANLLGSLRERNEMNYRNRQLAMEQQNRQAILDLQNKDLQLRRDEAVWRNAVAEEHNRIAKQGTDQYGRFMDWQMSQPTPQALKEQDYQNNLAERQAASGFFDDPAHVLSVYPKMSEAQAGILADQSSRARAAMTYDYQTAQDAAGTLNRKAELESQIRTAKTEKRTDVPWYASTENARKAKIAPLQEELGSVAERANKIQADKRLSALVSFDPKSGKYIPSVPAPSWGGRQTANPTAITPEDQVGNGGGQASYMGTRTGTSGGTPEEEAGGGGGTATGSTAEEENPGAGLAYVPEQGASSNLVPTDNPPAGPMNGRGRPEVQDNPPAGPIGKRKYSGLVYDRAAYWNQRGMSIQDSLARALQEAKTVQGDVSGQ